METLGEHGVDAVVELAPGGTLTGMVKRALKGTATLACNTPDDVEKAVTMIADNGGTRA
jgi:[acyl-carrier-protein] S-malonyltransferase